MDNNNKNLIVAVFLMLGVYFLFMTFSQPVAEQESVSVPVPVEQAQVIAEVLPIQVPTSARGGVVENVDAQDVLVETDLYTAVFTNVGARLKSIKLKNYALTADPDSERVSVVNVSNPRAATFRLEGRSGFQLDSEAVYEILSNKT